MAKSLAYRAKAKLSRFEILKLDNSAQMRVRGPVLGARLDTSI